MNTDGSLDTSFADLHFNLDAGNPNGYIYGIIEQADGKAAVIGNFTLANGEPRQYVARVATGDYATSLHGIDSATDRNSRKRRCSSIRPMG